MNDPIVLLPTSSMREFDSNAIRRALAAITDGAGRTFVGYSDPKPSDGPGTHIRIDKKTPFAEETPKLHSMIHIFDDGAGVGIYLDNLRMDAEHEVQRDVIETAQHFASRILLPTNEQIATLPDADTVEEAILCAASRHAKKLEQEAGRTPLWGLTIFSHQAPCVVGFPSISSDPRMVDTVEQVNPDELQGIPAIMPCSIQSKGNKVSLAFEAARNHLPMIHPDPIASMKSVPIFKDLKANLHAILADKTV